MALFNLGKKKEEKEGPACGCRNACTKGKERESTVKSNSSAEKISSIKVLGSGCKNCHALLENTNKAVDSLGLDIEVEYVTDMQKVMEYGVMSMPALVVNEKVVSMGRVLKPADIEKLFHKLGY